MSPEQIQKIRADLGITQTNMTIFSDMLTELSPGREHPEDKNLLEQLHQSGQSAELWPEPCANQEEAQRIASQRGGATVRWVG